MFDNTQDKGYLTVRVKKSENGFCLGEMTFDKAEDESNFYVDYGDGKIYIDYSDGAEVIGYYETTANELGTAKVYDHKKSRVIGRVGGEMIYFRKNEADMSAGRYLPEENCLAYYNQSGSITDVNSLLTYRGIINGSEIGGAAAFVALFNAYDFKSVYTDFFEMEYSAFKTKYAAYLD